MPRKASATTVAATKQRAAASARNAQAREFGAYVPPAAAEEDDLIPVKKSAGRENSPLRALREPARPVESHDPRSALRERLLASDVTFQDHEEWPFKVPVVEGISFRWTRYTVKGQDTPNLYYVTDRQRNGWEIMVKEDFPEIFPKGETGPGIKDGLILMARRADAHAQAVQRQEGDAKRVVETRERQLGIAPPGTLPRAAVPGQQPVSKEWMVPIMRS